jgi:hypothetical protein
MEEVSETTTCHQRQAGLWDNLATFDAEPASASIMICCSKLSEPV